ncbi:MAG TPA: choice-of-anchor tandem repeat GloVer-containing protein [Candidatus Baltobacteraceae bacterium]|nr:choice-of-anchor tandem repeat GloVer-containing protein [Candidatus Baltobacteraceae bacterium]
MPAARSNAVQGGALAGDMLQHRTAFGNNPPGVNGYQLLYSFTQKSGRSAQAGLVSVNGKLYGTTAAGGPKGHGNVFSVTTAGVEQMIYTFKGGTDGQTPVAAMIDVNGTLYGTTADGGTTGKGTVFSITPAGVENVIYSFKGGTDGASPQAAMIDVNGTLYGTTTSGGAAGSGTVFSVTPAGVENVIYAFKGRRIDGELPYAGLIDVNGTFYGTTCFGGTAGLGTVFSVTPAGVEQIVHNFGNHIAGGECPYAALIDVNGTLYGTTGVGGTNGDGTIFSMTPQGVETVLHTFKGTWDGSRPYAALIDVNGTLYGTTSTGGTSDSGRVFSVSTSGMVKVLHTFSTDSEELAPLLDVDGTLYGATLNGGVAGDGSIFKLQP